MSQEERVTAAPHQTVRIDGGRALPTLSTRLASSHTGAVVNTPRWVDDTEPNAATDPPGADASAVEVLDELSASVGRIRTHNYRFEEYR